jgi:GGDEF domain-containing protein
MKLKLTAIITAAVLLMSGAFAANAAVYTVKEPANGNTVYIAGDPDMYPIEYYDEQANEYKGILPELYKKISDESGIDFSYINAGTVNEQFRLAKNKQVEIVSAHAKGDVDFLAEETHILTYNKGDREVELCVGFTSIAPPDVVKTVSSALKSVSSEQILRISVETAVTDSPNDFPYWLIIISGVLAAGCAILVIVILNRRKKDKTERENRLTDSLTGIGNSDYFEQWYTSFISPVMYELYYIAYIGIDIQRLLQYADASVAQELQIYAAAELSAVASDTDFCARISDGIFALAFEAPDETRAKECIERLISRLNQFNNDDMLKYHIHLC